MVDTAKKEMGNGASAIPVHDQQVGRKPISSTLRSLEVGESSVFPIEQRTSVLNVANRIKKELSRIGWNYTLSEDDEDYTISIMRTK